MTIKKSASPLGDELRRFRYSRDFSQKRAAIVIGISCRTFQRAESGGRVSGRTEYKIKAFFQKTV